MRSLNGKTALVTGASRGMGRASALALAAAGAQVLVHYGRGAKEADGVVAEIRKAGGRAQSDAEQVGNHRPAARQLDDQRVRLGHDDRGRLRLEAGGLDVDRPVAVREAHECVRRLRRSFRHRPQA